jgi:predicted PhzF superfamily epimerase YddE/YHI9
VLWEDEYLSPGEPARFHTRSGLLTANRAGEWIELNFPATPVSAADAPAGLAQALGVTPRYVGRNRFDYLLELDDEDAVRGLRPNFTLLEAVECRGVIVTSAGRAPYDFISRFFAPRVGINEDPVTGSAHCCLGPYWQGRLGKDELLARQVSARGGVIRVRIRGDRVLLGGQAVTVLRGELC